MTHLSLEQIEDVSDLCVKMATGTPLVTQLKPATITINNQPSSPPVLSPQKEANTPKQQASTPQHQSAKASSSQLVKRDLTILNPPAYAARQGVSQIFDVLLSGTPFIRQLLLKETDIIYECRACHAMFRGLLNFVDHKKNYCTMRVGVANTIAAQSAPSGLQRWACQDKEPVPIIEPEAPEEEAAQTNVESNKKVQQITVKPKQQLVIRKPDAILVRPIAGTSRAMEQMVIRPDQVSCQSQLDQLSNFRKGSDSDGGTAKLVGEIAIRQAEKTAKEAQSPNSEKVNKNDKRDILHTPLKNVKGTSSVVKTVSRTRSPKRAYMLPVGSKSKPGGGTSAKKVLIVTLGQQKKLAAKQQQQQANKKKAICKVCKKECKNFTALAWHERNHKKVSFKCELCGSITMSLFNLKRHLSNVHHMTPSKVDSVVKNRDQTLKVKLKDARLKKQKEELGKRLEPSSKDDDDEEEEEDKDVSSSVEEDSDEEDNTSNTLTCTVCQKTFASKRNVKRHMEIHRRDGLNLTNGKLTSEHIAKSKVLQIMDEKNLKCRKCHKQLSGIRRLQQHCCNHFKLNRYRCSLCQYENVDYTQMRRHVMDKHGRHPQFRTINLISKAIGKMKVGLWINLIVNNEVDDANSTSTHHTKRDNTKKASSEGSKKTESKQTDVNQKVAAKTEIKSYKSKNGDAGKVEKPKVVDATLEKTKNADSSKSHTVSTLPSTVERTSRLLESCDSSSDRGADSANSVSIFPVSSTVRPKKEPLTPMSTSSKTTDIVLRTSSRCSSPASARKPTVPESPKRETPIRQARLNHRGVSSRVAQKLNLDTDDEDTPSTSSASVVSMLMDKRQNRCMECNKQFRHLGSLRRHVQIHITEKENVQKTSSATTPKPAAKAKGKKLGNVDSFINFSQQKCTKCHKRFSNMSALKRHVGRHLGYTTFKCRYCEYISHNYTWFKKHLVMNHQSKVKNVESLGKLMASMRVIKKMK